MSATPTTGLGFQNFFSATLTSDITSSSTDIPMDSIPNSSQGFLVIDPDSTTNREVIFYTSKTALKVTCPSAADGRGQDDTSAVAHTSGTTVIMAPVAAFWEALQSGQSISDGAILPRHTISGGATTWAWQTWTPSWTNLTVGNGTVLAKYVQVGKIVHGYVYLTFGSTTSISGVVSCSLPVTAAANILPGVDTLPIGPVRYLDSGTAGYNGFANLASTGVVSLYVLRTDSTYAIDNGVTSTIPFTWTTNDSIRFVFTYEAS